MYIQNYNTVLRWTSYVHIIFIIFIFVKNIFYQNEYTIMFYLPYNNLSLILIFIIIQIIFTLVEKKLIPNVCLSKKQETMQHFALFEHY